MRSCRERLGPAESGSAEAVSFLLERESASPTPKASSTSVGVAVLFASDRLTSTAPFSSLDGCPDLFFFAVA